MEATIGTKVEHENYGIGIVGKVNLTSYDVYFERAGKVEVTKNNPSLEILEMPDEVESTGSGINLAEMEEMLTFVLDKYGMLQEEVPLGNKWIGGKMILQPANTEMQSKEIPIEVFFHKIVMLRDRLRVLEQNINSYEKLSDEEKVNLQQYITKVYGSLTTFNILFAEKEHNFVGAGGK